MPDEEKKINPVAKMLSEGGLPQLIAGPAGKAISKLIAGAADIPAAWLDSKAQAIKNRTEYDRKMSDVWFDVVSARAGADQDFARRAVSNSFHKFFREQQNIESIVKEAIIILKEENIPIDDNKEISDDWLNKFGDIAKNISSEDLQKTLSRILKGELGDPGSISFATLHFMSIIDKKIAEDINDVRSIVLDGIYVPVYFKVSQEDLHQKLLKLQALGLFEAIADHKLVFLKNNIAYQKIDDRFQIEFDGESGETLNIRGMRLTFVGAEIMKNVNCKSNMQYFDNLTRRLMLTSNNINVRIVDAK